MAKSNTKQTASATTRWPLVFLLFAAGVIAAFQIGKAAIAIPLLRQDLGLSLSFASWVVSAYALLGAAAGFPVGISVARLGARPALVAALLTIGIGSLAGAVAPNGIWLLATRVIEGVGFIFAVVALPTLLRASSTPGDRDVVMSLWASYLPIGSVVMLLLAPVAATYGWQALWLGNGVLAIVYAGIVALVVPGERRDASQNMRGNVRDVLQRKGPLFLALTFGVYTLQYHALTGLMPTLLVERLGLSVSAAGFVTALTIVINALGNLSAGLLTRMGVPIWAIVGAAFVWLGAASVGIFNPATPVVLVVVLACATLGLSGVVPGSIFVGATRYSPPALLALTLGIVVQASNLGQFIGPAALGALVEHYGWQSAPLLFGAVACAGLALAVAIKRLPSKRS